MKTAKSVAQWSPTVNHPHARVHTAASKQTQRRTAELQCHAHCKICGTVVPTVNLPPPATTPPPEIKLSGGPLSHTAMPTAKSVAQWSPTVNLPPPATTPPPEIKLSGGPLSHTAMPTAKSVAQWSPTVNLPPPATTPPPEIKLSGGPLSHTAPPLQTLWHSGPPL